MLGIQKHSPAHADLEAALRSGVRGDVHLEAVWRGLYATDASIFQIEPAAVVVPRDEADVLHTLRVARERDLKVLPRGGGTSLAGQTVGEALVLDFSKYMNEIFEVIADERLARVGPGRVRDELNAHLAPTGLHFAPETATASRANVGGMVGNNSSGTRSIVYGKTVDHVLGLKIALATGEVLDLRAMSRAKWDEVGRRKDREGEIYRGVARIIDELREEILARYPKVMRRVGGYNLDEFVKSPDRWNLAWLVTGSEGTLATVLEATLNLEPLPKAKGMCAVHFDRLADALKSVAGVVAHAPSMVEIMDETVVRMGRENLETRRMCDWIEGDPKAVLVVEFFGDTMDEVKARIARLRAELKDKGLGYACPEMIDAADQAKVFGLRIKGLGLMLGIKGDAKPIPFIEDSAVPLEHLPSYIEEVLGVCRDLKVPVAMYAHASVGLIHVRPILDLKSARDVERMSEISRRTFDLVRKYGGSWSGEHGDGLVRSYKNEEFFGPKIYAAFREIKRLFDPEGRMNPGKIIDAQPVTENLRTGPEYSPERRKTWYHYRREGGFGAAVEMCTGVGECRKTLSGTMCPSYIATRDEAHSTRGRANALRLAMTGQLGPDAMTGDELRGVLDLCLSCKGCRAECPSNVDMAKLKEEFLAGYHDRHGATAGERFFAFSPDAARRFAGPLAAVANGMMKNGLVRRAMEKTLGLDRRRSLPSFTSEPFIKWFDARPRIVHEEGGTERPRVVLFDDTFTNCHEPGIGRDAVELLERLGYAVEPARAGCCTRTLLSKGFLKEAKERGTATMKRLNRFVIEGVPVIALEPGCLSALTDDLPDLIDDAAMGDRVAGGVMMIDEFLRREVESGRLDPAKFAPAAGCSPGDEKRGFVIHGHCHQKALFGTEGMKRIFKLAGCEVREIDSGCCGMAGSFGYETKHYDLSLRVGEDRLFPAVRALAESECLIACGFSCRHQISEVTGREPVHFASALNELTAAGPKELAARNSNP